MSDPGEPSPRRRVRRAGSRRKMGSGTASGTAVHHAEVVDSPPVRMASAVLPGPGITKETDTWSQWQIQWQKRCDAQLAQIAEAHDNEAKRSAALEATIHNLQEELAQAAQWQRDKEEEAQIDEMRELLGGVYAYGIRVSLRRGSAPVIGFCLLLIVLFAQLALAYGFYNASHLDFKLNMEYVAFRDPISLSTFYPDTVVGVREDHHRTAPCPSVDVLVAAVASLLLGLSMKSNAVSHLLGPHPIELLIWGELPGVVPGRPWAWVSQDVFPAGRVVVCSVLQLAWTAHGVIVPVLAGAGSALAFASSEDASQIVLNAMAISFIFDLDEFLYGLLLRGRDREEYERRQSAAERELIGEGSGTCALVCHLSWLVFCVDVVSIMDMWASSQFHEHYHGIYSVSLDRRVRNSLYLRGGVMGLVQLVLVLRRQLARNHSAVNHALLGLRLLVQAAVSFACCMFSFALVHLFFDRYFGYRHDGYLYPNTSTVDASVASDAGYVPGTESLIHQCLKGLAQGCQVIHKHFDWKALSDFVCDERKDCPSVVDFFGHKDEEFW